MHVVHLSLGFARAADADAFLDRVPVLTRLCEETARRPGVRVTALCRFDRDEDATAAMATASDDWAAWNARRPHSAL